MNAVSTKDRLKNISDRTGKAYQDLLVAYGLERTIYRISVSEYKERFILKGGIFLYALNEGDYSRVTTDIDLLAQHISNSVEDMNRIFHEIFSVECDDALDYNLNSLKVKPITELKEYHGVNVSINAYLDRTLIPVSIDIGFDDVIYPGKVAMNFPALLGDDIPNIYVYSIYSSIAEKYETIVSLGVVNSRYKDFYDIYETAVNFNLDGNELKKSITKTFLHRGTDFKIAVVFDDEFVKDPVHIGRWNNFVKKKKVLDNVDFNQVISVLRALLMPVTESIKEGTDFNRIWDAQKANWIDNPDTK